VPDCRVIDVANFCVACRAQLVLPGVDHRTAVRPDGPLCEADRQKEVNT
jgi:hypothetical protein